MQGIKNLKRTRILISMILILIIAKSQDIKAQVEWGLQVPAAYWLDHKIYNQDGSDAGAQSPAWGFGIGTSLAVIIDSNSRIKLTADLIDTKEVSSSSSGYTSGYYYHGHVNVNAPATLFAADYQHTFINSFKSKGYTLYGLIGFSLNDYQYSTSLSASGSSNGSNLSVIYPQKTKSFSNISLNAGIGLEYGINYFVHPFLEFKYVTGDKTEIPSSNSGYYVNIMPGNFNPMYIESALGIHLMLSQRH